MTSYAVIGASRGIGLEYVHQLAGRPNSTVFAVVRNAASSNHLAAAIKGLENVHVLEADVTDYTSLEAAAKKASQINGGKLDVLIHNAASMDPRTIFHGFDTFPSMNELDEAFITAYKVNALGVIHGISAFLPLLRASSASLKKIVVISTGGADYKAVLAWGIAEMSAYGMTKAAAVVATTKWGIKLKDEGFVVVSLSPGLVNTSGTLVLSDDHVTQAIIQQTAEAIKKLGPSVEMETPGQSVSRQLKVIDELKPSDNGHFLAHTGGEWKWPV